MKREQLIVLGGLIVALVAGSFIYASLVSNKSLEPAPAPAEQAGQAASPAAPTPTPTPAAQDFVLRVGPQKAGLIFVADYLETTKSGWLVLHEDSGGEAGEVIEEGVPQAMPGIYRKLAFLLRNPLVKGETYHAMFHVDDGDVIFEFPGADTPAKDKDDEVVTQMFTVK